MMVLTGTDDVFPIMSRCPTCLSFWGLLQMIYDDIGVTAHRYWDGEVRLT